MTKLDEIRNIPNNVIKVSNRLYIKVDSNSVDLYQDKECNDTNYVINDDEIKPLIKALQELIA